jgi:peptidoglycan/xylan/chitin deacetylase (PgdA/CDA1 family)
MVMAVSESRLADGGRPGLRAVVKRLMPRPLFASRLRPGAGQRVLLTFDDGPSREVTPRVLDRLDAYGARAVFFVVGRRVRRVSEVVKEASRRGHVIGNHSHLHRDDYMFGGPRLTLTGYYRDCQRCQVMVRRCGCAEPRLFRPPGGRVSPTTLLVPRLLGMRAIGWSVEVADWGFRTEAEARAGAAVLLARIRALDIVLLHDDNPWVLSLLDELLPGLRRRGLELSGGVGYL